MFLVPSLKFQRYFTALPSAKNSTSNGASPLVVFVLSSTANGSGVVVFEVGVEDKEVFSLFLVAVDEDFDITSLVTFTGLILLSEELVATSIFSFSAVIFLVFFSNLFISF